MLFPSELPLDQPPPIRNTVSKHPKFATPEYRLGWLLNTRQLLEVFPKDDVDFMNCMMQVMMRWYRRWQEEGLEECVQSLHTS